MKRLPVLFFVSCFLLLFSHCSKKETAIVLPVAGNARLSYGDSIFYLKTSAYTISPNQTRAGTYSAFPDNLQIDRATGAITVGITGNDGNSQTGLWYKIKFRSTASGESDSTMILLSGLTYVDKFYQLSQNESLISPIYNADPSKAIPPGNYDLQHSNDFALNPANGQINILECMRRGYFTKQAGSTGWKKATIKYAINDKSGGAINSIDILLYYYHTINEVPSNVSQLMQAHQTMTLGLRTGYIPSTDGTFDPGLPSDLSLSKPRPPCVVIVGN